MTTPSMPAPGMITVPVGSLREIAKWAFAASYFDGMVSLDKLLALPGAGDVVAEIAAANDAREQAEWPEDFDRL